MARGSWAAPEAGRLTVNELAERCLASNPLKRVSSVERDRSILRGILPVIGGKRLAQSRERTCNRWSTVGLPIQAIHRRPDGVGS
jgi:hypothetical protein